MIAAENLVLGMLLAYVMGAVIGIRIGFDLGKKHRRYEPKR